MIESALYFALGFLTAGLLALIVAPAIWLRAVRLTRRRIEAAQPLTLAEIKADRDMLRADFAVSARRLEMTIATLRHKNADQQIDVARAESRLTAADVERQRLLAEIEQYRAELAGRGEELGNNQSALGELRDQLALRLDMVSTLETRIAELNADLDLRKIESAALQTRLDALGSRGDSEQEHRKAAEARIAALELELDRRGAVITQERERADRLMSDLQAFRRLPRAVSSPAPGQEPAADDNERPAIERLESENAALETRLRQLSGERDALQRELATARVTAISRPADANDLAMLRDKLGDMAARMANLAAEHEQGPSQVDHLLGAAPPPGVVPVTLPPPFADADPDRTLILPVPGRKPESLAERIRALRRASGGQDPV